MTGYPRVRGRRALTPATHVQRVNVLPKHVVSTTSEQA